MLIDIPGYELTGKLSENTAFRVYRGQRQRDGSSVLLKVLNQPHPSPKALAHFSREFEILNRLNLPGVEKAYGLENHQDRWMIVLEDFGGLPVSELELTSWMEPEEFINLALQLVEIVKGIHARRIVHRNISPSTVCFNPSTHEVKLTNFAAASLVWQEKVALQNLFDLSPSLAYISPEMTGRMNRAVDYRTDYYSLGATLYELLTGTAPFQGESPLELFHAHLAIQPDPPAQRVKPWKASPAAFQMLSAILLKLLAKNPEDRYQTPDALHADLRRCLAVLRQPADKLSEKTAFIPGLNDRRAELNIPQTVVGREQESQVLVQAFLRTIGGPAELVLVSGPTGVGKSTLVSQLVRPAAEHRGLFLQSGYSQGEHREVYRGLVGVLEQFCLLILAEPAGAFHEWRRRLRTAVAPHGQLLINLCPQLEKLLGEHPIVEATDEDLTRPQFQRVVIRFLQAICRPDHPVIICLDDLQWSSPDSLLLWQSVLSDPSTHDLLVVGAYRDSEAEPAERIQIWANAIRAAHGHVRQLQLQNLEPSTIQSIVAAALASDPAKISALTDLVYQRTQGNPDFSNEFLKSLYRDRLLIFDQSRQEWHWDPNRIRQYSAAGNVVDLLIHEIGKLDSDTQRTLQYAACIGECFDAATLLTVLGRDSAGSLADSLSRALAGGLIHPLGDNHGFLTGEAVFSSRYERSSLLPSLPDLIEDGIDFEFQHNHVQQAVLAMLDEQQIQKYHLQLGWLLLGKAAGTGKETVQENIFAIADHINAGSALIEDPVDAVRAAELNLWASNEARTSAAFDVAFNYVSAGLELLPVGSWQDQYKLTLELFGAAAEIAMLNGDLARGETLAISAKANARTVEDKARITKVLMDILVLQTRLREVVELGIGLIKEAGFDLEAKEPSVVIAELIMKYPDMLDPRALAVSRLIEPLLSSAYASNDARLIPLTHFFIDLFSQFGNPPAASFVYLVYAMVLLSQFEKVEQAYRIGQAALELAEKSGPSKSLYNARQLYYSFIAHWGEHARESLGPLHENIQASFSSGNLRFAINLLDFECQHSLFVGLGLEEVRARQAAGLQQLKHVTQRAYTQRLRIWAEAVLKLVGEYPDPQELSGSLFDKAEAQKLEEASQNTLFLMNMYAAQAYLSLLFHEPVRALEAAVSAETATPRGLSSLFRARHVFVYSLALLSSGLDPSDLSGRLEKVEANLRVMRLWAGLVPENFLHLLELVKAEQARCLKFNPEAAAAYEQAFQNAMKYGYTQDAALAAELAAEFYLARQDDAAAQKHLQTAFEAYEAWGAKAKLAELIRRYPEWLPPAPAARTSLKLQAIAEAHPQDRISSSIDLNSILKASLELSQETNPDELLRKLMSILIENAGAQSGSLVLLRDAGWFIEVRGSADPERDFTLMSAPLEDQSTADDTTQLPYSLIHYVINTQAVLVLEDASQSNWVSQDAYIQRRMPRSILCAPLLNQGTLTGVVYLENNLATGAFTPDRLEMVQLISGQAAVSIEKARLYRNLEALVEERTRELSDTNRRLENEIHGRILVEEALRLSEEQYRAVFENTGTAMTILDSDGYILLPNEGFVRLTGYSKEELEDHFLAMDLVAPADKARVSQFRQDRLLDANRVPRSFELRIVDRSGSEKAILNTAALLPGSQALVISWIDISQRKAAEEALRYNETLLRKVLEILPVGVWILDKDTAITSSNPEGQRIWGGTKYVKREDYGLYKAWRSDTDELVRAQDWAGGLAVTQGEITLNEELRIEAFDGTERTILNSAMPLVIGDDDELVGAIVVDQDITKLKHHEDELQKAHDQLSTLLDISQNILSVLDLDRLLSFILEQLAKVIPYEGATILNVQEDVVELQVVRGPSIFQNLAKSRIPIKSMRLVEALVAQREPLYFPDIQTEADILSQMEEMWRIPADQFASFRSWLALPLVARDKIVGVLLLLHAEPDYYPPEMRTLAQAYASQIAIAIDNARLYKRAGDVATLEERNRLARELHDSVAQALYSISLFTDATRMALQTNKLEVVKNHVEELAELAREALSDMRLLIFELRPPILEKIGLAAALQSRLEAVEARAGFHTAFRSEGDLQLTPEQAGELYRIAQEALSNVIKHAHAKEVIVELIRDADCTRLTIQDDGVGFDVAAAEQNGGQGFRNIHERAEHLGAKCWFDSAPKQGTKLTVEVNT